jgi:hypothetical protein
MTEEEKRKRDEVERMLQDKYRNAGKSERSVKQREDRARKREGRRNRI